MQVDRIEKLKFPMLYRKLLGQDVTFQLRQVLSQNTLKTLNKTQKK
jgi:hypothetical protein